MDELQSKRPLLPPMLATSPEVADVINTFRTIAGACTATLNHKP